MALTLMTAIFGSSSFKLHEPKGVPADVPCICFTDQKLTSARWEVMTTHVRRRGPRRTNRQFKLLAHRYVEGPVLYLDAEYQIDDFQAVYRWLEPFLSSTVAAPRHPLRRCLFDEGAYCLAHHRVEDPKALHKQMERYSRSGMPRRFGLWSYGVFYRSGSSESVNFGETWWEELYRGSERDQISGPFTSWSLNQPIRTLPGSYMALPGLTLRRVQRR